MATIKIQEALNMAKADPNSEFATSLRATIDSGDIDKVAFEQGVDLTQFGRPEYQPSRKFSEVFKSALPLPIQQGLELTKKDTLTDIAGDVKQTFTGVKNVFKEGQEKNIEIGKKTVEGEQSAASGGLQVAGQSAMTVGNAVGELMKGAVKTVLSQDQEQKVKDFIGNTITSYAGINDGRVGDNIGAITEEVEAWTKENPELSANLVGAGQIALSIADVVTAGEAGTALRQTEQVVKRGFDSLSSKIDDLLVSSIDDVPTQRTIKDVIVEDKISKGIVDDTVKKTAEARGFQERDAQFISTLSDTDKKVSGELIDLAEKAAKDRRVIERPIDIVGNNLVKKETPIRELNSKFGKQVGEAADDLRGTKVDVQPIKKSFGEMLDELNIGLLDDGSIDYRNSAFARVPEIQNKLSVVIKDAMEMSDDGLNLHFFKKSLDEVLNFGATGEGLKGGAERIMKRLRTMIDDSLDNASTVYKEANDNFRITRELIDESDRIFGKTGISKEKAANRLRRVFSNADSRGDVIKYLAKVDEVAEQFGIKTADNLVDQAQVTEILEDIFGSQATTSLQGQVKRGVSLAQKSVRALKGGGLLDAAGEVVGEGLERVLKQTDTDKINFLKETFNKIKKAIKDTPNKQGGFVKNPLASGSDDLIAQAKKFDNVDDFVGKQKKIYHGTSEKFDDFDLDKTMDNSIWFTDDINLIKNGEAGAAGEGRIMERFIDDNNLKLGDWDIQDKFSTDEMIAEGFDGLKLVSGDETTYRLFDLDSFKSEKQLKDIFNKAKNTK